MFWYCYGVNKFRLINYYFLCINVQFWPNSRGIYHNDDKTFLCWVNEEDQFRIISMQEGGDIKAVFERLANGQIAIEAVAKFSFSYHLGYLKTCPTNVGTGLRASIHIKLPKISKQ